MLSSRFRHWADLLKATPLHPQWLLRFGPNKEELLKPSQGLTPDIGCANRWPEALLQDRCTYMLLNLGLGGMGLNALRNRSASLILLPLLAVLVLIVNLAGWVGQFVLPTWPALSAGYTVVATKP